MKSFESRADSRFVPSQRETALQNNAVSHWLGANLASCDSRADSRFAPSQWKMLQSNGVSHWLGANIESALESHTYVTTVLLQWHLSNMNMITKQVNNIHIILEIEKLAKRGIEWVTCIPGFSTFVEVYRFQGIISPGSYEHIFQVL